MVTGFVYLTSNKTELYEPAWVSFCQYIPAGNGMRAITYDNYIRIHPSDLENWSNDQKVVLDPSGQYLSIIKNAYMTAKIKTNYHSPYQNNNSMIITKVCPSTSIVKITKNVDLERDLTDLKSSSARFLEIEYKCGDGPTLAIEVPKSHYFTGNELLSKSYVLRYLEHLPIYVRWTFIESEYALRIIDEDSEVFSLNIDQYIVLEQDGYRVVNSSKPFDVSKRVVEEEETKETIEN